MLRPCTRIFLVILTISRSYSKISARSFTGKTCRNVKITPWKKILPAACIACWRHRTLRAGLTNIVLTHILMNTKANSRGALPQRIWWYMRDLYHQLKPCRFSFLVVLIACPIFLCVAQGTEILRTVGEGMAGGEAYLARVT